ncbi:NADP-dependent oxidoreductase [Alloscardovia theropitheci]|uniref:NADP-dependent oxidoreductase n=1 Tax=Alloscardovia theropitheci TaxID=2496842 RepID=A0A4R0QRB0_9BIFI|nr:NADP-dependent oxidoreductase [Alloscardovia theropitheci]TCD53898.1 NADP-dependent oxidoreductase [Alloscardovia theropitheci]
MKSAQLTKYDKDNISFEMREVAQPHIRDNEVLVKTLTAGVNPVDNMISRGEVKMITPYKLPLIAGNELVGVVEEVGSRVEGFSKGDRIFSRLPLDHIGAFAEYVAVDSDAIAHVPSYLSDVEAAAIPLTGLTVMQAFDLMHVEAGKTIFISGGTGGVGAIAIPLAKAKGLTVITNGSASNKERVLSLGADRFLDYKTEDYTKSVHDVDYVLDTIGGKETEKQMGIMKPGGHIVSLRAMPNGEFARRMNLPWWKQILLTVAGFGIDSLAKKYKVHYSFVFVQSNGKQLREIAEILENNHVKASIDSVYSFSEINKALDKVANGHARGKTVVSFESKEK